MKQEKRLFMSLKTILHIDDGFLASNLVRYCWDNRRRNKIRAMARLDRIYRFQPIGGQRVVPLENHILGDCVYSDHLFVWRRIQLTHEQSRPSKYVMNTRFLTVRKIQLQIERIWGVHSNLPFYGKVRGCIKYYKSFCIRKASERK